MNVSHILMLFISMVALALAMSVVTTNLVAAVCLIQYALISVATYESERVRSMAEEHATKVSLLKITLLLVAFVDLLFDLSL